MVSVLSLRRSDLIRRSVEMRNLLV
jgi:hypothetical protein